ncbi:hypothetical protein [uncultured Psychrosphaera sp.]|jgi:hypothetical protein|uniref:hypothetical protein n=1 Tax=uncultured Psychrosphaera sp. TaxID=1403522 RepID=UPI00263497B9|nr:hypothetical protein [uncultured Psychrosphaera sp.]
MNFANTLVTNVTANQDTNMAVLAMLEMDVNQAVQYHVYEVAFGDKMIFCCLSGGVIEDNEIQFTPIGLGAFEAMTNIKTEVEFEYFADEINKSNGNISDQIEEIFTRVPNNARVCLIGDITGELKDELSKYFKLLH